jgi:hypothetical protein
MTQCFLRVYNALIHSICIDFLKLSTRVLFFSISFSEYEEQTTLSYGKCKLIPQNPKPYLKTIPKCSSSSGLLGTHKERKGTKNPLLLGLEE